MANSLGNGCCHEGGVTMAAAIAWALRRFRLEVRRVRWLFTPRLLTAGPLSCSHGGGDATRSVSASHGEDCARALPTHHAARTRLRDADGRRRISVRRRSGRRQELLGPFLRGFDSGEPRVISRQADRRPAAERLELAAKLAQQSQSPPRGMSTSLLVAPKRTE